VQGFVSAQALSSAQQFCLAACWQTLPAHVSVVHGSPSSHVEASTQQPAMGASVHAFEVHSGLVQGLVSSGH